MACGLYWAEGEKGRNSMRFSNTDPLMVKLFYDFLLAEFPQEKVVIHFYYHDDLENSPPEEARSFWAKLLGLGESSVRSYKNTDARPRSGVKKNRHKHGICTLTVHSTRVVQHIYGALDEYAGVDVGKK